MALIRFLSIAAACAICLPISAAASTATCADRTFVVEALMERFGEVYTGNVTSDDDELLEIYSNEANRTWTILLTLSDRGLACLVASGTGDQQLTAELANLEN